MRRARALPLLLGLVLVSVGCRADAVAALRATTLALDVSGRRAWRSTACRWFEAATVLDATSPAALPAIKAALDSKWSRRC